jgi:uncharacterized protein (TIGR04222 family)
MLVAGLAGLAGLAVFAPAAHADAATSERITSYDVTMNVGADAVVHVKETIGYDFGTTPRHGITRDIPYLVHSGDKRDRRYDISGVRVTGDGAQAQTQVTLADGQETIRVGDPAVTVTGRHTYVIEYDLGRALTSFTDHDELYLDAIGDGWAVPIDGASVSVTAPSPVTGVICFAAPTGASRRCDAAGSRAATARFTQSHLDPNQGLTVAVKWRRGAIPIPAPVFVSRHHEGRLLHPSPIGLGLGACLLLLVPLMYVRGRPDKGSGTHTGPRSQPPPGVRPAMASGLLLGKIGPLQVVATFADLAARGHLRIVDQGDDFLLVRTPPPRQDLAGYEVILLRAVFASLNEKPVSHLKYWFARVIGQVRDEILAEAVRLGWFRRRPDRQRRTQLIIGGVTLATSWLVFVLALIVSGLSGLDGLGYVPVGQALTGLALLVMTPLVQPRTALGSDLCDQVKGFREVLRDAAPPELPPERLEGVMSAHLPYAIAFRLAPGYTARFERMGVHAPRWYVSRGGVDFSDRFTSFTTTTSSTLSATQSSSGGSSGGDSGFSGGSAGGGGGGGGGGSW